MSFNEWSYDTAQPPLVYTAKVGGKTRRIVSVATMEGVWFAYDAASGQPIYQRIKVIDRTEHPALQPGKPVAVFPSSLGGVNYSPASFDPKTNFVFNAAAETASAEVQAKLTPTQKKRKFTLGDVFLGLENGNFGSVLPGWHDHGSISAIDVNTGRARLEVHDARARARRRDDDRQRPRLRRRRRRRAARLRPEDRQGAVDVPDRRADRGRPVAVLGRTARSTSRSPSAARRRRRAAARCRSCRCSRSAAPRAQSTAPTLPAVARPVRQAAAPAKPARARAPRGRAGLRQHRRAAGSRRAAVEIRARPTCRRSRASVLLNGAPVAGAHVVVDGFAVPQATAKDGSFPYDVDITLAARHAIHVSSLEGATVHGRPLERRAAERASRGVRRLQRRLRGRRA